MKREIYRQGDVLLVRVRRSIAKDAAPVARVAGRLILAYGEVTGHAHAIDSALAELFEERGGALYLRVRGPAALTHEEHAAIALPRGTFRVFLQREYAPGELRQVAD
jgi:hypothetical protein